MSKLLFSGQSSDPTHRVPAEPGAARLQHRPRRGAVRLPASINLGLETRRLHRALARPLLGIQVSWQWNWKNIWIWME